MAYGDDLEGKYLIHNRDKNETMLLDSPKDLRAYVYNHHTDWLVLYMHEREAIFEAPSLLQHLIALAMEDLE